MELPFTIVTLGVAFEQKKVDSLDVWACLRVNPLDMPRTTYRASEGEHSQNPPCPMTLAPVAKTGFSHRLTAYKIVEPFSGLSYRKISGSNQVKNIFF